jgi:predicted ATP-binding protein involved in virulence
MFSINCLEITATKKQWNDNKSLYKNLLSENDYKDFDAYKKEHSDAIFSKRFFFNDFYYHEQYVNLNIRPKEEKAIPDNFFGSNINIQAIVGKNGSGKSSLMDLMYMAINNFAFMFERGKFRPGAEQLYFIPNLYITIYFSFIHTPTHTDIYRLQCKDDSVWLISEANHNKNHYFNLYEYGDNIEGFNDKDIKKLVEDFFYSIVSNYSLQSFIPANYKGNVLYYDDSVHEISKKKIKASWINSIFHKNDSYIRSIVLNPFRGNGKINLENEIELSKDRLTALLIWYKQEYHKSDFNSPFFPYEYNYFLFCYKESFIFEKMKYYFKTPKEQDSFCSIIKNDTDIERYIDKLASTPNSFLSLFFNEFFINKTNLSFFHKMTCAYIIIKILSIVRKYPSYLKFQDCCSLTISDQNEISLTISNKNKTIELFDVLKEDCSHITKKLRRAINFLRTSIQLNTQSQYINGIDYFKNINQWYSIDFPLILTTHQTDKHQNWLKELNPFRNPIEQSFLSPAKIDECLPPSLFSYELYVNNIAENRFNIPYRNLSSGEIQLLQTLSIHTYHLENIFSITESNDERPKYYAVNLVFDEVEICLHPEYQRLFVKRLLKLISSLEYSNYFINIFIITHSPFVLSDIPHSNILYMETEEDKAKGKKMPTHTFAQNIGEMMYDSFFMEKTIGDFAETKIKKLIKKKLEKDSKKKQLLMSDAEEHAILSSIGDPVIRSLIEEIEANDD